MLAVDKVCYPTLLCSFHNDLPFLAPIKTLSQIISEGLGLGDKPDYISVKAMTTLIKKDTAVYMVKLFQENIKYD